MKYSAEKFDSMTAHADKIIETLMLKIRFEYLLHLKNRIIRHNLEKYVKDKDEQVKQI